MPYLTVNNVTLFYEDEGCGAPLLFVHGWGTSSRVGEPNKSSSSPTTGFCPLTGGAAGGPIIPRRETPSRESPPIWPRYALRSTWIGPWLLARRSGPRSPPN